jgi:hypothetical protein
MRVLITEQQSRVANAWKLFVAELFANVSIESYLWLLSVFPLQTFNVDDALR